MSQLTQLIEQARNRRGINDLFKTKVDSLAFSPENQDKTPSISITDQLDELAYHLDRKSEFFEEHTEDFVKSLKEVLELL